MPNDFALERELQMNSVDSWLLVSTFCNLWAIQIPLDGRGKQTSKVYFDRNFRVAFRLDAFVGF